TSGLVISSFDVIVLEISIPSPNRQQSLLLSSPQAHPRGTNTLVIPARLVANGSSQQLGIDCDETFSPVVQPATIRTVLSLAVSPVATLPYSFFVRDLRLLSSTYLLHQVITSLHNEFDMTNLEALNYFLGISATRHSIGLFLSQKQYAIELLVRAHMTNCNPSRTLVYTDSKLGPEGVPTISRSSAEAEYRGVANVVAKTAWLRNLLRELNSSLSAATLVYCDNVSTTYLSANPVQHQRTKHIEINIHFVRDLVTASQVRVIHVPSRYQYADIFTKGVPSALFEDFRSSLSVRLPLARTAGGRPWTYPKYTTRDRVYCLLVCVGIKRLLSVVEFTAASYEVTTAGYGFYCCNNMQTQTSNTLHNAIMEAGSKDRPPMLALNPPYELGWKEKLVLDSEGNHTTTTKRVFETYKNVTHDIRDQLNAEAEAVQIILIGIDNDIHSTVDACPNACEMWKAIERLKQGESINVQDLETNLFWEFGKFTSLDGESLESYYSRFYKMMNELIRNQCKVTNHQNTTTATRNRGKAIVNSHQPIYDQEPSMVNDDDEMSKEKEIDKLMALISLSFKKIYKPTNNNLRTSSNTSRANQDNSLRIHRNAGYEHQRLGNVAGDRETVGSSMKPKRAKDAAYHREKMLLCKQEEAGIQLNAEQADWKDDTDDESDDQELEAHYMYMAKLQQIDQNDEDADLAKEHEMLASLINKLKCEIDETKHRNTLLETSNKVLVEKLKSEIEDFKNKNKSLTEANHKLSKENDLLYADFKKSKAKLKRRDSIEYASEMELACAKVRADWRDDTDDESKDQELEAHYMYMAQIQEVTPDAADNSRPIFDTEPMQKDDDDADDLANESNNKLSEINALTYNDLKKFQAELDRRNDVKINADLEKFHLCLKEEMVPDLRYFNSLELEVDSLKSQLETQKTQFLNEIDRFSREYYYGDHMNAILSVYTELDEFTNLQYEAVKWESIAETRNLKEFELEAWKEARKSWIEKDRCKSDMLKQKSRVQWIQDGDWWLTDNEQNAFIKGRFILDGSLIANEAFDFLKKKKKRAFLLKTDFEKACDSVNWKFIIDTMGQMGVGEKWCKWVEACLNSATVSVLVNGSPTNEFIMERGVRQGDPISPFLFLIAAEGLNVTLNEAVSRGIFKGLKIGHDDIPTKMYAVGVRNDEIERLSNRIGVLPGFLPFTYLGLSVGVNMKKIMCWNGIVEKVKKISWKSKMISYGGRLTNDEKKKFAWVKWDRVVSKSSLGGLDIDILEACNLALLEKWWWRFPRLFALESNKQVSVSGRGSWGIDGGWKWEWGWWTDDGTVVEVMGQWWRDTIQLDNAVSTISQEYLLEFTFEYGIPEGLHPELPGPEDTIPEGNFGGGCVSAEHTTGPLLRKNRRKRVNDGVDANAPPKIPTGNVATLEVQDTHSTESARSRKSTSSPSMVGSLEGIYQMGWGVTNNCRLDTPDACQDVIDHIVPPGYFYELRHMPNTDFLSQYNKILAQQVAMGSQLRLRFEQEVRLLKKARAQVARQDQRIQVGEEEIKNLIKKFNPSGLWNQRPRRQKNEEVSRELENLRTWFTDLQVNNDQLTQQVATLQTQVTSEEKIKTAFEEFKKYKDDWVEKRCAEMDARLDALSIYFDEELYPHMLTVIAGRRWVIGHGLRLAVIKCVESIELRQAFANVVSTGIAKGMSERLEYGVKHGGAKLDLAAIEGYEPEADDKYIAALHALKDLKYPLVDQLESLKDAPIENPWAIKEEMLLKDAIAANVSRAEKKKKCWVVCRAHGVGFAHHARSDGIPVSAPTIAPQGLAILLLDAATQTETSEDDASPRLLRSKSLPPMYSLDWP
nr:ribonuclease H-like domain-containing protein [Tanacetum cinerariifolium]